MADPALLRAAGLLLPLAGALLCWGWRRPDRRAATGVGLAVAWNLAALVPLHGLARRFGWWAFQAEGGVLAGMPVDLLLGWCCLWGVIPVLAFPRLPVLMVAAVMAWLDLILMPLCAPVVTLQPGWWRGELVAVGGVLLPGLLLARWTREDRNLPGRLLLQALTFGLLTLVVLPTAILEQTGGSWTALGHRPPWVTGLWLQVLAGPVLLGLSAVQEFGRRGRGTPIPFDPPRRLVTSGLYAYVANPMQCAMALLYVGWGLWLDSGWIAAAGTMAAVYSAGLAAWDEGSDLKARFGRPWERYRGAVRNWLPRWRPWHRSLVPAEEPAPGAIAPSPARLYVAQGCDPCSTLGAWVARHQPVGMVIHPAEQHPHRDLWRLTYDPGDGTPEEEGVAALARALEHLHLGWALVGCLLRLPVINPGAQLLVDAVGGGPRLIRRGSPRACTVPRREPS